MRFIQIGVGGFGRRWVDVLKQNAEAQVVGMVDVNPAALQAACELGGYAADICFGSLEEALDKVSADAVVVATPPAYHRAPVVAALERELHVISEKPMAESLADCKAMLAATLLSGQTYTISQNYRYSPATWTMAQRVREGLLGQIGQVKVDFYLGHDFNGGFRHSMDYPLIVDMSIHHFDLIRFITGLDAVAVSGQAWNPPWSNYKGLCSSSLVFEMSNGARVLYNGSWCAKGQYSDWNGNWLIEGETGALRYEKGDLRHCQVPGLYKLEADSAVTLTPPPKTGQDYVLDSFIHAIGMGQRTPTDVYDNIHSVAMVFAAVEALRTGQKVAIVDDEITKLLDQKFGSA